MQADDTKVLIDRLDLSYTYFALGRFIGYRLEEGFPREEMLPWMAAYLRIRAILHGQECPDANEQLSRAEADEQKLRAAARRDPLCWLPRDEEPAAEAQSPPSSPCTADPRIPG